MALALLILQQLLFLAALFLLAQFVVALFDWRGRRSNAVWRLLVLLTRPLVAVVRRLSPRVVLDRHVPVAVFVLALVLYLTLGLLQRDVCRRDLAQAGCERWVAARAGAP